MMDRKTRRQQEREAAKQRKKDVKMMAQQLIEGGYYLEVVDGKPKIKQG